MADAALPPADREPAVKTDQARLNEVFAILGDSTLEPAAALRRGWTTSPVARSSSTRTPARPNAEDGVLRHLTSVLPADHQGVFGA